MIGIYKITSPSGKIYIGQSVNIEKRFNSYRYGLASKQPKLNRSFIKHGFYSHLFEIVCECDLIELNDKERYYQEIYDCIGTNGLNLCYVKSSDRNGYHSEETKKKISLNNSKNKLGYKLTEEEKNNLRVKNLGKKHSEETKKKISIANKGRIVVVSEETKEKLRIINLGKKHSEETIKKMILSHSKSNEEVKIKRKEGLIKFYKENPNHRKGIKFSDERKKKLRDSKSKLIIIDLETGIFFFSISECVRTYGYLTCTMFRQLKGISKNKTNLKII